MLFRGFEKRGCMKQTPFLILCLMVFLPTSCAAQSWTSFWRSYIARFMDSQIRVIDHDTGDRTTSEGQAYGMFFALVANDHTHFDGLLRWTEANLAGGDLTNHLPAWEWGRNKENQWAVLDANSASDADIWMAYTLLEAGRAWKEPRLTQIGAAMAHQIAAKEVAQVPDLGAMVLPGSAGFQHGDSYRLNASYVPLQLILGLSHFLPHGPWAKVAAATPALIRASAPRGFVSDWIDFDTYPGAPPSDSVGSYDAIRVYLWTGMLDKATPHRGEILKSLWGMANYLSTNTVPPAKVSADGKIEDPKGPPGFSAALLPYAAVLHETRTESQQMSRLQSAFDSQTGLYGNPPKYYDQNLALFGLGFLDRQFWFNSKGALQLKWEGE